MDGKPNGVVLAQVMFALVGVLFVIGTLGWALFAASLACHDNLDPHCGARAWAWTAFPLTMAVGSLYVAGRLDGEGWRVRLAWWVGIAVGALIALAGAAIIHSPVRTHQDDLIPELLWGLAVLVVAGIILTALLVPSTRRRVKT